MDIVGSLVAGETSVAIFALGMTAGAAVGVLGARLARRPGGAHTLQARVDMLELRFATAHDYRTALRAVNDSASAIFGVVSLPFAASITADAQRQRWLRARSKSDAPTIAQQLAESIENNVSATMEAGDAIVDNNKLGDAAERRRVAGVVKRAGAKLSTAFWQTHGDVILRSAAPETLKAKFKAFYAQVGTLKRRISGLADEPTISDLLKVVEDAVELLTIAIAIADEVKQLTA